MKKKLVVITGGSGYIGSVLTPLIAENGFRVRVLDRFFFGETIPPSSDVELVKIDSRNIQREHISDAYAVLDLAALSNDPTGELDPVKTMDINYRARRRLQEISAELGVDRYILASSCSVYGFQNGVMYEDSSTSPLTTYAHANLLSENAAMDLHRSGTDMAVVLFRQATMYGLSPRMRFDIALNGMTLGLWKNNIIPLLRDGSQWRPMVHIRDTSKAFLLALTANKESIAGEHFNVGSNQQNFQMFHLAELVAKGVGKDFQYSFYGDPDTRSYQVNFDKIHNVLGFVPDWTPELGAKEIADALEAGEVQPDIMTRTLAWYTELLQWESRINRLSMDGRIL